MKRLVIDIETVGMPWDEHDPYVREYLLKDKNEAEAEEEKRRGGLSPFRGRIVAIGVINADDGRSCVLYEVPGQEELKTVKEGSRTYISGTEKLILEKFWEFMNPDDRFISFNGRQFDGPFIMIRSAINGVVPKRDLVGYRYAYHPNCDLRDALSFNGTLNTRQARFNLDFACKAFGITSSKTESMDGRKVEELYYAGRYDEIANYCLDDVRATCELYLKLVPTILTWNRDFSRSDSTHPPPQPPEKDAESFVESLRSGPESLEEALKQDELNPVITTRPVGSILERLVRSEDEEEIPAPDPFDGSDDEVEEKE